VTAQPGSAGPSIDALLAPHPIEHPPVISAGAAVTIVLRNGLSGLEILLIERAVDPDDPASGQVALPGGHVAESDGNLSQTALRELEEEVGLTRLDLASEPHYVTTVPARRFGIDVGVFAAALSASGRSPSPRSPAEVAHVFWLPSSALGSTRRVERDTSRGIHEVNATVHEGHVLWGFTRRVLRQFFGLPQEDEPFGPAYLAPAPPADGTGDPGP
jgi:8-oxo-dGTP pyrophosphatase MutT (NUDIX family)